MSKGENSSYPLARRQFALEEIQRTIHFALVRCRSVDELICSVPRLWENPLASEFAYRLSELELSDEHVQRLLQALVKLAENSEGISGRERANADRILLRLTRALPLPAANELAELFLEHHRKPLRRIAYRVLRNAGVTSQMALRLLDLFRRTGDEELLELIARTPEAVVAVEVKMLLQSLSDRYWRARVIEALLTRDQPSAVRYAREYPKEFVHAVGRVADSSLLHTVDSLFADNCNDTEFLSLFAWALGKLGARERLDVLMLYVQDQMESLETPVTPNSGMHPPKRRAAGDAPGVRPHSR